jgi:hypothetical protein
MGLIKLKHQTFANVLSDGKIRIACQDSTPNAVKREWELKDGSKGTKYELVYDKIDGIIKNLFIYDGNFGKTLQITIDDIVLCLNMKSNFADDFMRKLPNIDLEKTVEISPYSFETKEGKTKKGVSVIQNGEKIKNFFYDEEAKKAANGYPELPKGYKKFDSDDWSVHFIGCNKFLAEYMVANIVPKLPKMSDIDPTMTEAELDAEIDTLNEMPDFLKAD